MQEFDFKSVVKWWRAEPVIFIREILNTELWSRQREIVESVRDNGRTTVRSASAVGKTRLGACIALWFLCAFYPSTVLTTGKSYRQVREQLWREISALRNRAKIPIGGNLVMSPYPRLDMENDWFALGFATDEAERWTGFHNQHVLEIVDEASGIPEDVYGSLENPLASGILVRQVLLGNPTQSVGKFRDSFASSRYKSFHISAYDTPAFTGEGDFPFLIGKQYVEDCLEDWGEDSPLYEVYIMGNFPSGETDRLIPFGLADAAIGREIKPDPDDKVAIGVDTARFGDDENALYVRKGGKVIDSVFWRKSDTEAVIGRIVHEINKYDNPVVNIDEGYNPGVVDGLKKYKVNGISFQGRPKNDKLYANVRAEIWWHLADKFKEGTIDIPNDKILLKQITDIKKRPLDRQDKILIESKEEMKKRGLKSPDRGDALALCFMESVPKGFSIRWV